LTMLFIRLLTPVVLFIGAGTIAAATTGDSGRRLQVLLQGESSTALAALVREAGGDVTHELSIINAVGARLSRAQLDSVSASPLVHRHIDDLDVEPDESRPDSETRSCEVGAALQLRVDSGDVLWPLFNKRPSPAPLTSLALEWPPSLGHIKAIRLGQKDITPALQAPDSESALSREYPAEAAPELSGHANLRLQFAQAINRATPSLQNDMDISLTFDGDCEAELVPAYEDNAGDTYFPAVVGADLLHRHGITGTGVTVAVLDSGLWEQPALSRDTAGRPRIAARYDAITGREVTEAFDESGHGTHMTSILAHSATDGTPPGSFKGIAPDSTLAVIKAFNYEGKADLLDLIRGIQYVVEHKEALQIRVLNLSFAARPRWPYWLDPVNQALMKAWAAGIAVVAAAGNEGPEPMSIGSPGNLPYIITVGAVTDSWTPQTRDDDYIPDFSSRGPTPSGHIKPDLVAPGGHMTGLTRPGSMLAERFPEYILESGDFVMTGTSQAAALVSGAIALLLQLQPELPPDDIKCRLTSSAEPAINRDGLLAYSPFQQGSGYMSITRAIALGETGCENQDMNLAGDIAGTEHFTGPATFPDKGPPNLPGMEKIYSGEPTEKGMSTNRRWGAKAHIERLTGQSGDEYSETQSTWYDIYLREKSIMEALAAKPLENKN